MKHLFILAQMFILSFVEGALLLSACAQNKTTSMNEQSITMTQAPLAPEALAEEWDKTFPLSEKVNHKKVTFKTQYGFTLAADLYIPKDLKTSALDSKRRLPEQEPNNLKTLPAIAVCGPFGAIKEQCSTERIVRFSMTQCPSYSS